MKFSCERCGKKYATAEAPAPGKVYKLKCKGCGHLIVIRVSGAAATAFSGRAGVVGSAAGAGVRAVTARPAPGNGAPAGSAQTSRADTSRVSLSAATPAPGAAPAGALPPPEPRYVDLFSDLAAPEGGAREGDAKREDALHAAARASLPEAYQGARDPLAPLADAKAGAAAPLPVPQVPEIPVPPRQRSTLLIVLVGVGVAVLAGILAFVLLGPARRTPPLRQPPPVDRAAPEPARPAQEAHPEE